MNVFDRDNRDTFGNPFCGNRGYTPDNKDGGNHDRVLTPFPDSPGNTFCGSDGHQGKSCNSGDSWSCGLMGGRYKADVCSGLYGSRYVNFQHGPERLGYETETYAGVPVFVQHAPLGFRESQALKGCCRNLFFHPDKVPDADKLVAALTDPANHLLVHAGDEPGQVNVLRHWLYEVLAAFGSCLNHDGLNHDGCAA